jgi:ribosome-associated toxin RatA of RatAB toxin-antitoxin module
MCDTAVVVRPDRVLFAKNSDRDPNEAQLLDWQPRRGHSPGASLRCTWIEIPQVAETWAVLLSRPFWMWGAEMGANEHGVVIGNEAVFTRRPLAKTGLLGMDLLRLALERAESAEQAVDVITELLERHGQGGGCGHENRGFRYHNSFLVADAQGAFVVETADRHWVVEPVQGARSISNGLTVPEFAARHADRVRTRISGSAARRACTQSAAEAATGPADMMRMLRDHGPGNPWPRYSRVNGAMSAPCVHAGGRVAASQTTASWVAELRPGEARHWVTATAAPCIGLFKPVRVDEPLDLGPAPDDRADGQSLWWRHERLHRRVLADPERLAAPLVAERDRLEQRWLADPPPPELAFKEGDALLARWSAALSPRAADRRPRFVRRYWATRARRAGLGLLLLALLVGAPRVRADAAPAPAPPSVGAGCIGCLVRNVVATDLYDEAEWQRLSKGDVLIRHENSEDGGAGIANAAALLPNSPGQVWAVLTDFETWPDFMPLIRDTRVTRRLGGRAWVEQEYRVVARTLRHTTIYDFAPAQGRLSWQLDSEAPHDIAATQGRWQFVPFADGEQTLLRYRAAMDPGRSLPGFLRRFLRQRSLEGLITALRDETARRYRDDGS